MRAWSRWMRTWALVGAVVAAAPAMVRADRIWTKAATAGAKPFERKNLKIVKIEDGELVIRVLDNDRQDKRKLGEIFQIEADGETKLNTAEVAYAAGDFAKATDEYRGAIDASKAPWVKVRSASRMVEAATQSKNFPAAVKGYAALVKLDAGLASNFKPTIPTGAPGSLTPAVAEAKSSATASGVTPAQKEQLLTLALELARANGDNTEASAIAKLLEEMAGNAPPPGTGGATAGAPAAGDANRRIQLALVAIGNKDFASALKQINAAPESFTEPADQVEALYCMAEAKNGLAKSSDELKDAALDYMRAVARSKSGNVKSTRVADALFKTAVIHERIRATDEAALLYQQIATEFADSDAATAAKATAALSRIEKAGEK